MSPRASLAVAALIGALTPFGFAPIGWFPLPVLTLAGLFWLARNVRPAQAFLLGFSFGLGLFLVGVSWVYISLATYGGMPVPVAGLATGLFCAFIALLPGLALWLAAKLTQPDGKRLLLSLPAAWALLEWTRGWLFTGFPWLTLGYAQTLPSPLAGYAPLLGVYGVSLLAALSAGLLVLSRQRPIPALAALAALWVAGWGLQQVAWTHPVGKPVSVALLQGNIAQELKFRPEKLDQTLRQYARAVLASEARLIVLPETALPLFRSDLSPDYLDMLGDHARARGGDVLLGMPEDDGLEADGRPRYYNSMFSLGSSPEQRFRKTHLVPFGEFVPFGFRWLVDMMQIPLGDFNRGAADQPAISAAGERLALNICYEDVFGEERIHAARDATLLVNVSNDAWFGDSWAPWQHLQIGAMRSLEAQRWQLRSNNTGITAILDNAGRVQAQIAPFSTGTLQGKAQGRAGLTPYLRWGNLAFLGIVAGLLITAAWSGDDRLRGKGSVSI